MSKRNGYFEIIKKRKAFVVRSAGQYHWSGWSKFSDEPLYLKGVKDLNACGGVFIATETNDTYSLYYINENKRGYGLKKRISGIQKYQYLYGNLVLEKEDFYLIIKPDWCTIYLRYFCSKGYRTENFLNKLEEECKFKGIKNLEILDSNAFIVTETDDTYSLYFIHENKFGSLEFYEAISGIKKYQYFNGILLLNKLDYYVIISLKLYWKFSDKVKSEEREQILNNREKSLEKILANEVYLRDDFNYEKFSPNNIIFNADGIDYYFEHCNYDIQRCDRIFKLDRAEAIPGDNGCVKVISTNGEYIFEGYTWQLEEPKYYNKVVPFADEDYTAIHEFLSNAKKKFKYGYWFKDEKGAIERMALYTRDERLKQYEIIPQRPAKSIEFVRHNKEYDVWRIIYPDNEEFFLLEGTLVTTFRIWLDPKDLQKK